MKLLLEKRGMNFYNDSRVKESDIGNYRVTAYNNTVKGKDGNFYLLNFYRGTRRNYRKVHKITGKPLKKPVIEVISENVLFIDTQYENKNGCFRNSSFESIVHDMTLPYTKESILKVVNMLSCDVYDEIVFTER